MKYDIINGKVTEKLSKENKITVYDQKALVDMEYFDYMISQLPSIEDLLKVIIKYIDITNNNINFITRHLIKDQVLIP